MRYGTVRARVAGLQAVLADGTIIDRPALLKDNAGYDLAALLVGSEGTLGVITRVRWRLVARLPSRVAALIALASLEQAATLLADRAPAPALAARRRLLPRRGPAARARPPGPARARAHARRRSTCCWSARPWPTRPTSWPRRWPQAGIEDAVVADDSAERERLWRFREGHAEAISAAGVPHKLDVGVPLARLAEFAERVREEVQRLAPAARA